MSSPSPVKPNILALIPAFNEEVGVADVIHGASKYLPVLVVDDGSHDRTAQIAEEAGAVVLRQVPNQGKGAAMRAGFQYALQNGYAGVITLDADRQHNPDEIPIFFDCYTQTQADLIIGARDFRKMPIVRRCSNTIGRVMFSWALGQKDRDNQSGYRFISNRLMEKLIGSTERGFEFEVEMLAVCVKLGYRLEWVTIQTIYAGEKSHIVPLRHIVNWFRIIAKTRRIMRTSN
ncbi:glycosyltransferase family 2 protein [Longilinea arvoryzae]|nr:glycosyltransferase family 2 protein [Longilinea arvoryzae]